MGYYNPVRNLHLDASQSVEWLCWPCLYQVLCNSKVDNSENTNILSLHIEIGIYFIYLHDVDTIIIRLNGKILAQ